MKKEIQKLGIRSQQIKQKILEKINNLPDNTEIARINKRCFVINSSKLSTGLILSPEYYDFKVTYRIIIEEIINKTPQDIFSFLTKLVKTGGIKRSSQRYTMKVHAKVIQYIKELIS